MKKFLSEKNVRRVFEISVILKGLHAASEILGGIILFFISKTFVLAIVLSVTQGELAEDPHDPIARYLINAAHGLSIQTQHFAALYLLNHGIVQGFLVWGLFKGKMWIYPVAIVVFGFFILYQLIRFSYSYSIPLLILTLLDIVVLGLTWHEYIYRKSHATASI